MKVLNDDADDNDNDDNDVDDNFLFSDFSYYQEFCPALSNKNHTFLKRRESETHREREG